MFPSHDHAKRWWAVYDSIESSVKHHIKLWHSTHRYKDNYNAFDKYAEAMAVIIPKYSNDADPENIRLGFSEDAYAKRMFSHLKLAGFDPKGPTGQIGQNTPATPNVQPLSPLTTPPSAPVGKASKPVGRAPGPANAEKEAIAGALGDYMKANRSNIGVTGSIHQWLPRHPGKFVRGYQSWHNVNRALDIGGWSPSRS